MRQSYPKRVLVQAWADTLAFFGWNRRSLVVPALLLLGALIQWHFYGWDAMMAEMVNRLMYGLAPFGLFGLVLFGWNLVAAPARMQADADKEIDEKQKQLEHITNKLDAVDELSALLSDGIHVIWNAPIVNDQQLADLDATLAKWHSSVVSLLKSRFNNADVDHFNRLGVVPVVGRNNTYSGVGPTQGRHATILMQYALQEQRLREIVRDHNVTHI